MKQKPASRFSTVYGFGVDFGFLSTRGRPPMRPISLSRCLDNFLARALPPMRANPAMARFFISSMYHEVSTQAHLAQKSARPISLIVAFSSVSEEPPTSAPVRNCTTSYIRGDSVKTADRLASGAPQAGEDRRDCLGLPAM